VYCAATGQWNIVIPDYRGSYAFETRHGHSERTKLLLEELLCLPSGGKCNDDTCISSYESKRRVVLVGHSQGGAVSACVCSPRVVRSANIVGK
jgi:pimeloyl-ACP methyl ester carboxylesterase